MLDMFFNQLFYVLSHLFTSLLSSANCGAVGHGFSPFFGIGGYASLITPTMY